MIINNIKKHGIVCVNVLCGNLFILHQEEFVFGQHNILEKFLHSFYDEYWVLEMYAFMTEYIELITDKPTYLLPYVWNDTILKKYLMNHKLEITIDYHQVCREKINILRLVLSLSNVNVILTMNRLFGHTVFKPELKIRA